jgi:Xaa-Pro aminopeptidase
MGELRAAQASLVTKRLHTKPGVFGTGCRPDATVHFASDIARAVAARLERAGNRPMLVAPRRFMPNALINARVSLDDGTALLDTLLMHKLPAEIEAIRRAARMADDAYGAFRAAVRSGRAQYEVVAEIESYLRSRGCPNNFMIIGSGGKDVLGMTPASERRISPGDLVTTELTPATEGYFVQICRTLVVGKASNAQRQGFAVFREALEATVRTDGASGTIRSCATSRHWRMP